MRAAFAVMGIFLLAGCDVVPVYAPVPVSPAEVRYALSDVYVKGATVRAVDGRSPVVTWTTDVEFPREPSHDHVKTNMGSLRVSCEPTRENDALKCELDGRKKNANVFVPTGRSTYQPAWETVGRYTFLAVLAGGVIAGETYCFAECDSGGRIALGVTDVVVPLVAVLVVFTFIGVGLGAGG